MSQDCSVDTTKDALEELKVADIMTIKEFAQQIRKEANIGAYMGARGRRALQRALVQYFRRFRKEPRATCGASWPVFPLSTQNQLTSASGLASRVPEPCGARE